MRSVGWKRKGFVVKKRRFRNERIQYPCFNNTLFTLVISIMVTKPSRFYKILRIRALLQRSSNVCFQSALPQGVFIVNISYYYIGKRYINIIVWQGLELDTNNTEYQSKTAVHFMVPFSQLLQNFKFPYFTIPYELL